MFPTQAPSAVFSCDKNGVLHRGRMKNCRAGVKAKRKKRSPSRTPKKNVPRVPRTERLGIDLESSVCQYRRRIYFYLFSDVMGLAKGVLFCWHAVKNEACFFLCFVIYRLVLQFWLENVYRDLTREPRVQTADKETWRGFARHSKALTIVTLTDGEGGVVTHPWLSTFSTFKYCVRNSKIGQYTHVWTLKGQI